MNRQQLSDILSTHDFQKPESILKTQSSDDFYKQIIWLIDQEVFQSNEHPKDRTKVINRLISVLFDSMHAYSDDLPAINKIIDEYINELRIFCQSYLKKPKDETYFVLRHTNNKLKSLKELTIDYMVTNNHNFEYDLLWYLINDVESYEYIEMLLIKNPNILNQKQDGKTFFNDFLKMYYQTILKFDVEDWEEKNEFYSQILTLFIANPQLKYDEEFDAILFKIMKDLESGKFTNGQQQELMKLKNSFLNVIKVPTIQQYNHLEEYHKPWHVGTRLDLRPHQTITIDDTLLNDRGQLIIFDDAFTLFKNGNGYMLYVHFADVPSHLRDEKVLSSQAKQKIFSIRSNCEYNPLFPDRFARNHLSLEPRTDRYAVSIALEINSNGIIDSINFYETIIQSKRAYSSSEVDSILNNSSFDSSRGLLEDYALVAELLSNIKEGSGHNIPNQFNTISGKLTAEYFASYNLPMIFRNCVSLKKLTNDEQRQMICGYITDKINPYYLEHFLGKTSGLYRSFYDTENNGHHNLRYPAYAEVSSPIRNYVSSEILRGVKQMVINGQKSNEVIDRYYRDYAEVCVQANAIEAMYTKK